MGPGVTAVAWFGVRARLFPSWSGGLFDRRRVVAHLDGDVAALSALGEPMTSSERAHLSACPSCRMELVALERVVAVARAEHLRTALVVPPADLWALVAAAARVATAAEVAAPRVETAARVETARVETAAQGGTAAGVETTREVGLRERTDVGTHRPRRRRNLSWLAVAAVAAVGAGVGVAGTLGLQQVTRSDSTLASVDLQALPGATGSGHADLVRTPYGDELFMSLQHAVPTDTYLQVWLLSRDADRMVPIGVISTDVGRWAIPEDIDLREYPLVDVSIEPYDGDPRHSRDSLVRGVLDPTGDSWNAALTADPRGPAAS